MGQVGTMVGVLASTAISGFLASAGGCGGGGGASGVDADPLSGLSCAELRDAFATALDDISRACDSRQDCALVGTPLTMAPCDCRPAIGPCQGVPVNQEAYAASRGRLLEDEYYSKCDRCGYDVPCICDCGEAILDCVDGECRPTDHTPCLTEPPDAAPADAPSGDAAPGDAAAADGGTADAG